MIRNRGAFTKKWALFCAGKQFTDKDLVYRHQILREEDFRAKDHERASFRFCSVFYTNLSNSCIHSGGDFTGNGWESCNFTKADYTGLRMEMDDYNRCNFGNAKFQHMEMLEIKAKGCNFTGSIWQDIKIEECIFTDCVFRKVKISGCQINKTRFENCIFDELVLEECSCKKVTFQNCRFIGWKNKEMEGCAFPECTFEKD